MIYIIIVFIVLLMIGLFLFLQYLKIKSFDDKINTCLDNITEILDNKETLVFKIINDINDEKLSKKSDFQKSDVIFQNENALFDIRWNLNQYINNKKINENYKKDLRKLNIIEESLDGLKDFYNITVLNYNELFLKKPFYFFYKLLGFEQRKSFKIRKLEEYVIFKI